MTRQLLAEGIYIGGRSCETSQISTDDGRERRPSGNWTDRNVQREDRRKDEIVPLCIRNRDKRPVNLSARASTTGILKDIGIPVGMR